MRSLLVVDFSYIYNFPRVFIGTVSPRKDILYSTVRIVPIYRDSNDVVKLLFARKMAAVFQKSHAHKEIYCFQSLTAFIRDFQQAKDKNKHWWPFWKLRYSCSRESFTSSSYAPTPPPTWVNTPRRHNLLKLDESLYGVNCQTAQNLVVNHKKGNFTVNRQHGQQSLKQLFFVDNRSKIMQRFQALSSSPSSQRMSRMVF